MELFILNLAFAVTMPFYALFAGDSQWNDGFTEGECISLAKDVGVSRPPMALDLVTQDFETMGCCYNDGLKEPRGC